MVTLCDHRFFSRYLLLAGRPMADAVVEITSGCVVVLNRPTTTSPFCSVLAITFSVLPLTIIDESSPSWSTESTARLKSSFRVGTAEVGQVCAEDQRRGGQ